jgi:hypothetical protein
MEHLESALPQSPNFQFLEAIDADLLRPLVQAERFLAEDPAVSIGKLRLFAERSAKVAAAHLGFERFCTGPVLTIGRIVADSSLAPNTIASALEHLRGLGIARELTGKKRDRVYAYAPLLAIMSEGT